MISIVIPVYNVGRYIEQCVESIFPVQGVSFEILLIDDGSEDDSPDICDLLAKRHPEIRVIHKENGGAADARNVGIREAKAGTIMFADGDDFFPPRAVERIAESIRPDVQVLTMDFYEFYGTERIEPKKHLNIDALLDEDGRASSATFSTVSPLPMPWLYAIDRGFLIENRIFMHKGLLDEDEEWTARLFACRPTVALIKESLYFYRRNREASLTYGRTLKNTKADLTILRLLTDEIKSGKYDSIGCVILENKCRQMIAKIMADAIPDKERKAIKKELHPYMKLLKNGRLPEKIHYYLDPIIGRKNCEKLVSMCVAVMKR